MGVRSCSQSEGFERYSSDPLIGSSGRCEVLGIESARGFVILGHLRIDPPGYKGWHTPGWTYMSTPMRGSGPIGFGATRRVLGVVYWNNTIKPGPPTGLFHARGIGIPWIYVAAPFLVPPLL